jgi:hypothetical protein
MEAGMASKSWMPQYSFYGDSPRRNLKEDTSSKAAIKHLTEVLPISFLALIGIFSNFEAKRNPKG